MAVTCWDGAGFEVGVVHQLAVVPVATDQGDLRQAEAGFEQSRNGLVAEVVEAQMTNPGAPGQAAPGLAEGAGADGEQLSFAGRFKGVHDVEGARAQGHGPGEPVF